MTEALTVLLSAILMALIFVWAFILPAIGLLWTLGWLA